MSNPSGPQWQDPNQPVRGDEGWPQQSAQPPHGTQPGRGPRGDTPPPPYGLYGNHHYPVTPPSPSRGSGSKVAIIAVTAAGLVVVLLIVILFTVVGFGRAMGAVPAPSVMAVSQA